MKKNSFKRAITVFLAVFLCACSSRSGIKEPNKSGGNICMEGDVLESNEQNISIGKLNSKTYKPSENANPISPVIYCADPTAVEYEGRLYVYGTCDHQQYEATLDDNADNTYEKIRSLVVFSTDDMANWTYHGRIDVGKTAPWIYASWAPSITSRVEADGETHFYLYFSNSGAGVGVITATNPLGPWSDPLGRPLISGSTPGLIDCPNPFDPGVVIDDNGIGWLSFGGGVAPGASEIMPKSARIVKLGDDMLSFASDFSEIPAPYFFEASELNYIGGKYVYTCCSNWIERSVWDHDVPKPKACAMLYMVSSDPLDPNSWDYCDQYFLNPGDMGYRYANNHTHLHKFEGKYYIFNHSLALCDAKGASGGFRSLCVDEIEVDERKVKIKTTGTDLSGTPQTRMLDGSGIIEAETMASCSMGILFDEEAERISAKSVSEKAEWILLKNVKFGSPSDVYFKVKGCGRVELRLDSLDNEPFAWAEFDCEDYSVVHNKLTGSVSGNGDVYVVIYGEGVSLDRWQLQ